MTTLFLMRHGHSPSREECGARTDALRPLSERGRRDAERAAAEILRRGGRPELILHSPLLRAAQTAAAAGRTLGLTPEAFCALDNTLPPAEVLAALRERAAGVAQVLAVGHQPQVGEIAALLIGASPEFRPATVAALELSQRPRALWTLPPGED